MAVENPTFSLDQARFPSRAALTPEEVVENQTIVREIALFASTNLGQSRYQEMSDGHLRTYTLSEERCFDPTRKAYVDALTVSVEETRQYQNSRGDTEAVSGKITINPYNSPLTRIEVRDYDSSGGIGRTTSAHLSTPAELRAVLHGLTTGSLTDPRATSWRAVTGSN